MPIVIRCACGRSLKVNDDAVGRRLACPACGAPVTAAGPTAVTAEPPVPAPATAPPPLPPDAPPAALGEVCGVWILMAPMITGPNITVLTEHALCLERLPVGELKEAKRRLSAGAPVPAVLGPTFRAIPLSILQAVRVSNKDATVVLGYLDGERRAQHTLQYAAPVQQWVFDALRERLGPGWHEQEPEPSTAWSAASLPGTVIGFLLFMTVLCFLALRQKEGGFVETSGRGKAMMALIGWIPSVACIGFAVVLLLAGLGWIVYAIRTRRPAVQTITKDGAV